MANGWILGRWLYAGIYQEAEVTKTETERVPRERSHLLVVTGYGDETRLTTFASRSGFR